MSVEQAIHQRWATHRPLTELVPAERLYTGRVPARSNDGRLVTLPYVSLSGRGDRAVTRTSGGAILRNTVLRFEIFAESCAAVQRIAASIEARFFRADADHADGHVLDMKPLDRQAVQEPDGVWKMILDFQLRDACIPAV